MSFTAVESWALANCEYTPNAASAYLVLFYFTHYGITAFIFFEGLVRTKELYLVLLSFGITLNFWLNYLLLWAFMQPVPVATCGTYAFFCIDRASNHTACGMEPFPWPPPPNVTCGSTPLPPCDPCVPCGMPALEPQLTAFTVASVGIFAMQWRSPHIRTYQMSLLIGLYTLVMYSHMYFRFNDSAQVLVGAFVGALAAIGWQLVVFHVAYPRFDTVLAWPLVRRFGYKDTFCRAYAPVDGDPEPLAPLASGKLGYAEMPKKNE